MQKKRIKALCGLISTPAGPILVPVLVVDGNKALRPMTIDGIQYINENGNKLARVFVMLTPIHFAILNLEIQSGGPIIKNGQDLFWVRGSAEVCGIPFYSIFAIEFRDGYIKLYHHTTSENVSKIYSSGYFYGSKWNFMGTNKISDYENVYLTDLPEIVSDFDLAGIGMQDFGTKLTILTDEGSRKIISVYSDQTSKRNNAIKVWIKAELLGLNGLIFHKSEMTNTLIDSFNFYNWIEIFCPNIFRVSIPNESTLPFKISKGNNIYISKSNTFTKGFLAARGNNIDEIELLWDENYNKRKSYRLGENDSEWDEYWKYNLGNYTQEILDSIFSKLS